MRGTLFCAQRVLVLLLSCLLSMLSGEIYLRLKPYLVVKISSDIVTEYCCRVEKMAITRLILGLAP